jgi:tRNA A58 N-methylase Trm61
LINPSYWSRYYTDEWMLGWELDEVLQGGGEPVLFAPCSESMTVVLPRLSRDETTAVRREAAEDIERELATLGRKKRYGRDLQLRQDAQYLRGAR